jgi:exodeoxyribonuclease V alpha subunit
MMNLLNHQGTLSELDIRFGRFMMELSEGDIPELFLAAALVSHYKGEGNICCDLTSLAGKPLFGEAALVCPDLKKWLKILKGVPVVGKPGDFRPLILDGSRLYLFRYWNYERKLADSLKMRTEGDEEKIDKQILNDGLSRLFPDQGQEEPDWQKVAAVTAVMKKLCVISGGPGTGKTFTVAKILALLMEQPGGEKKRIVLAAPTGKAAARLQEAIKNAKEKLNCSKKIKGLFPEGASTLHRLLKSIPDSPYFRHNAENPLAADVVIIDEASMVDLALLSKLAQAVSPMARLILLGDKDQLASVEAGAVLGDICDTGKVHVYSSLFYDKLKKIAGVKLISDSEEMENPGLQDSMIELRRSYRFGVDSGIRAVSRAVNEGDSHQAIELLKSGSCPDIHWKELPQPELLSFGLKDRIIEGFSVYLQETDPAKVFEYFNRLRILGAIRKGPYGIEALNFQVEQILQKAGLIQPDKRWYRGRPVLITKNDYTLKLFNGDVGIAWPDPEAENDLRVLFQAPEGGLRKFPPLRLPDHETVYAMTVHKSQGSEFDQVLFLMPDRIVPVLTRELIYTAITRAKEKVEVWGKEEVFRLAISRRIERASGLREALWG